MTQAHCLADMFRLTNKHVEKAKVSTKYFYFVGKESGLL